VLPPLAVFDGLKDPHAPTGVQLQLAPSFAESLVTVAATVAVFPTISDDGGGVDKETEMGAVETGLPEPPPQAERVERRTTRIKKEKMERFISHLS
jgi:hypothetical protein